LGKEEAPASHLIDAIGSWQVLRELFSLLLLFRKVWVYYIRTFLFVKNKAFKKVVHFLPKQQSVKSQATDSLDPKVVFVKTLEVANY
jgi:hypothetical protein